MTVPRLLFCIFLLTSIFLASHAGPASAAYCSDYPNQAAAQEAKDTYDGDADGIFCEAIPCPCSPEWHMQHGPGEHPPATPTTPTTPTTQTKSRIYRGRITRVVDGDTLRVKTGKTTRKVRVIGIDTPEPNKPNVAKECGADQATSAAVKWSFKKRIDRNRDGLYESGSRGRMVTLKSDNTQQLYDQYGRLLAYVSRGSKDFGKSQIAGGWAELFVWQDNPFKRLAIYSTKLKQAKAKRRGLWRTCGGDFHSNQ